jgi:hypothetical protein
MKTQTQQPKPKSTASVFINSLMTFYGTNGVYPNLFGARGMTLNQAVQVSNKLVKLDTEGKRTFVGDVADRELARDMVLFYDYKVKPEHLPNGLYIYKTLMGKTLTPRFLRLYFYHQIRMTGETINKEVRADINVLIQELYTETEK